MSDKENAVKMQKLRRTLDRLRNVRASGPPQIRKQSWIARLMARLGLNSDQDTAS